MPAGDGKQELDYTLAELQEDYIRCVKLIRKTYGYLERVGLKDFNKYSKYKWSMDRERGYSYVCVRYGSSLRRKSLVKSSGLLEDAELYKWIENKDLVCEALDEASEYISAKVRNLRRKMDEAKSSMMEYEEKLNDLGEGFEELEEAGGARLMRSSEDPPPPTDRPGRRPRKGLSGP